MWLSKPPCGIQLNKNHPLARGLLTCWMFNEGSGLKINDLSGNNNNGTMNGFEPFSSTSGWSGSSKGYQINFDGINDYIRGDKLIKTPLVTLEVWVTIPSVPASDQMIAGCSNGLLGASHDKELIMSTNGTVYWYVFDGGLRFTNTAITLNKMTHIVGTSDGARSRIYKDGTLRNSVAAGSTFVGYTVPNIFTGGASGSYTYLNGSVKLMRLWNHALSAQQIQQLYAQPYEMFELR